MARIFALPDFLNDKAMKKRGNWRRDFNNLVNDVFRSWESKVQSYLIINAQKKGKSGAWSPLTKATKKWRKRVIDDGQAVFYGDTITQHRPILLVSGRLITGIRVKVNKMNYTFEVLSTARPIYYTGDMANKRRHGNASNFDYGKELNKNRPFMNVPATCLPPKGKKWIEILNSPDIDFNKKILDIIEKGELKRGGVGSATVKYPGS